MKKTILSLEGVAVLSKTQQKQTFGGKVNPITGGGYPKCYLPFGSGASCLFACGEGYSPSLSEYGVCTHHN